jgi:ubiquinone/menaquinone biosynthesis C-methylase UbiE
LSTAQIFDRYYNKYDLWYLRNAIIASNELETILSLLDYPYHPCIEIGVGTGWFSMKLMCDLGVDPSYNMLLKAKQRGIEVVQGTGEYTPARTGFFKAVIIIVTICFVDDPVPVLKEARRIIDVNGRLIVCIVPRNSQWGEHYISMGKKGHPFYSVARFYTSEELVNMAYNSGFTLEKCMGSLRFHPEENPVVEKPSECIGREGFQCMRFKPSFPLSSRSYR